MHVRSEDLPSAGNVTFIVGAWKSNRMALKDATPLAALASAAMSASSSSPWSGGQLFTPVQHSAKNQPSMTPTSGAGKAGARRDATPNNQHSNPPTSSSLSEGDLAKRNFVLEVIRKQKLTRRAVAEQAYVIDFRAMNYWLRGKEVDDATVKESGRKLMEWATKIDPRGAASKAGKFDDDDDDGPTTDDEGDEPADEQDEEEERSPRATSAGKKVAAKRKKDTTPSHPTKKTRATPNSSSSVNAASAGSSRAGQKSAKASVVFAEPAPRVTPLTPIPKEKSLTPWATPNLRGIAANFMESPMLASPGTFAWGSPVPFTSPFPGQTPVSVTTAKKPRSSSIDDHFRGELTPLQSPMTSPLRGGGYGNSSFKDIGLTDDMFNGMEMPMQTPMPNRTQSIDGRTPMTATRTTPGSNFSSSSSAGQQRTQPRRQLSFDER